MTNMLADNSSPSAPKQRDGLIGSLVASRYRVIRQIGQGGMGVVYLAEHVVIERKVVLKVLSSNYAADAALMKRFLQEARAAASLDHANIVKVFDFGETDNSVYIAMEYLEGDDLTSLVRDAPPLSYNRMWHILKQVCAGLHAAHLRGMVHRDLKPENIFLTERDGEPDVVKILDFGLVQYVDEEAPKGERLTQFGMVMGTPEYMAPEQTRGEKLDARCDIYALGCVVYEMLTGNPPFLGTSAMDVTAKHCFKQPVPPSECAKMAVTPALELVCLRALEKERDQRFSSMEEMSAALEEALSPALSGEATVVASRMETSAPQPAPVQLSGKNQLPPSPTPPQEPAQPQAAPQPLPPVASAPMPQSSLIMMAPPGITTQGAPNGAPQGSLIMSAPQLMVLSSEGLVPVIQSASGALLQAGPVMAPSGVLSQVPQQEKPHWVTRPIGILAVLLGMSTLMFILGAGASRYLARTQPVAQPRPEQPKEHPKKDPVPQLPKPKAPDPTPLVTKPAKLQLSGAPGIQVFLDGAPLGEVPVQTEVPLPQGQTSKQARVVARLPSCMDQVLMVDLHEGKETSYQLAPSCPRQSAGRQKSGPRIRPGKGIGKPPGKPIDKPVDKPPADKSNEIRNPFGLHLPLRSKSNAC